MDDESIFHAECPSCGAKVDVHPGVAEPELVAVKALESGHAASCAGRGSPSAADRFADTVLLEADRYGRMISTMPKQQQLLLRVILVSNFAAKAGKADE